MRVVTGREAADMLAEVRTSRDENNAIYDYLLCDGAVVIRKRDRRCIYMKQTGRRYQKTIAIEGTPEEIAALALIDTEELRDMIDTALTLPRLS